MTNSSCLIIEFHKERGQDQELFFPEFFKDEKLENGRKENNYY